jgi:hypothetical protein
MRAANIGINNSLKHLQKGQLLKATGIHRDLRAIGNRQYAQGFGRLGAKGLGVAAVGVLANKLLNGGGRKAPASQPGENNDYTRFDGNYNVVNH